MKEMTDDLAGIRIIVQLITTKKLVGASTTDSGVLQEAPSDTIRQLGGTKNGPYRMTGTELESMNKTTPCIPDSLEKKLGG